MALLRPIVRPALNRRHGLWPRVKTLSIAIHQQMASSFSSPSSQSANENTSTTSTTSNSKLVNFYIDHDDNPHIGYLVLQSPVTLNALTVELGQEFQRSVREQVATAHQQEELRAVIVCSQGANAFSAGGNLEWLRSLRHNSVHANADAMMHFYNLFLCLRRELPVATIAALQGPAMGAGAGLALACDVRIAAVPANHKRLLGLHFTQLGIHAGMGTSHYLPQLVASRTHVNEILLSEKVLTAQECCELGLLNRLIITTQDSEYAQDDTSTSSDTMDGLPKHPAIRAARQWAVENLLTQHPVASKLMLQTLRAQQDVGLQQALQTEALAQALCYNREDWGEGVNAMAEKRTPTFDGYHYK
eukprot:CAMPEP_0168754226 /NCGR_PEP_ID=MMETSP0724-20121128/19385_1 /TAXON_ID=265536 /ORGANISM="Amphiprora sp., Strain CCMP467" /LENGTH=359 /DNA_ID=CAMNT_0008802685 /DNA_START=7 /DNA_END=1086 /DNA_ORIENTATION=-